MFTSKTLTHIALLTIGLASITHTTANGSYTSYGPPSPIRYYKYPQIPKTPHTHVLAARGGIPDDNGDLWVITEYTSGYESTGKNPSDAGYGITATGTHATQGRTVACDPQRLPMGTRVWIDGVGTRTCEDTGGAIKGNHIDVFINDLHQALQFGKQIRTVRVLGK